MTERRLANSAQPDEQIEVLTHQTLLHDHHLSNALRRQAEQGTHAVKRARIWGRVS
jgi:hypothetical protein